jgi:hypothetical protein
MSFKPVRTLDDLNTLDDDDILAGYREYSPFDPWPGENRGRAYWHGWRNRAIDCRVIPSDSASTALAQEYLKHERARLRPDPPNSAPA